MKQVIVVFVDRACQGILDRHNRVIDFTRGKRAKNVFKPGTRAEGEIASQKLNGGFFAEGSALPLKRNSTGSAHTGLIIPAHGPCRARASKACRSADPLLWHTRNLFD